MKALFMSSDRGKRTKEDGGDNERNLFLFPGLSNPQQLSEELHDPNFFVLPSTHERRQREDAGRDK